MKIGLTSQMSPLNLDIKIGIHSETRQENDNRGPGTH